MVCESCSSAHCGDYGSGRFCNSKCARSFSTKNKREEINKKVSLTMESKTKKEKHSCPECGKQFLIGGTKHRKKKFCSRSCNARFYNLKGRSVEMGKKSAAAQKETRRSKNEIMFADFCIEKFNNVLCNVPMFNGWDADVILRDQKIAVHWNGNWHYKKLTEKHSVAQVQNRDRIKCVNIERLGYNNYVIKDTGKHNPNFVRKEFDKFIEYIKVL